jgi:hypothetical protein
MLDDSAKYQVSSRKIANFTRSLSIITGSVSGSLSGRVISSQSLPFSCDLEGGFCTKPGSMGIIDPTSIILEPAKRMRAT